MTAGDPRPGDALLLAPGSWARPLDWVPTLSAYITAVPPDRDVTLHLDARAPDVDRMTVRALVEQACTYLSNGLDFAAVILLEGAVEIPPGCEPVSEPAELLERLDVEVAPLQDSAVAISQHARWVKALVDVLQAQVDRARLGAAPPMAIPDTPLVTVQIPLDGHSDSLLGRTITSVLAGAYPHLEILVCGAGLPGDARAAIEAMDDGRVRYVDLGEPPEYPSRPPAREQMAHAVAVNRLMDETRGAVIAPLDHGAAFTIDHVLVLLDALRRSGGDLVYGTALSESADGAWGVLGTGPWGGDQVVNGAVMYSSRLSHLRCDPHSWLVEETPDWNRWRRMRDAGARIHQVPAPVAVQLTPASQSAPRERDQVVLDEQTAADVLATSARQLLRVSSRRRGAWGLPVRSGPRRTVPPAVPPRRLALLDTHFPFALSGFRWHEAKAMLELLPDTVFFSLHETGEGWPVTVRPLETFPAVAGELGITDVYSVFLNFAVGLLGLEGHPGTDKCAGIVPGIAITPELWNLGIRFHTTLYPGGGLVADIDPELLRAVATRAETVFTNATEVVSAVPDAVRIAGSIANEFYAFRDRPRREGQPFRIVFAADDRPRKGLDTALAAFQLLDARFVLDIAGPNERYLEGIPRDRITLHGFLEPERLRELYWSADAFVSPVRPEGPDGPPEELGLIDGFPTTTASEALASGCALISANPRGDHWVLAAGEHYLEIPSQDPVALAGALDQLERDRELRDRLARQGASRVREMMDVQATTRLKLGVMGFDVAAARAAASG
ncbi:MAG TPA: glycosyltransferase [Solirubrobacteraceae bacterium]|nr:glycosyltransferase [Solirubrobacteraceae bacterium]